MWLWHSLRRHLRARERIEFQQDVNIGFQPHHWKGYRVYLGGEAYDADSPEYENYITDIASERPVSHSE